MSSATSRSWSVVAACVVVGALAFTGCGSSEPKEAAAPAPAPAAAPPAPAYTPAASINELMVAWVDNAAHVVWDVEKKGFEPKNDADWVELEDHSTQLAVAGSLLPLGGNGPADAAFIGQAGWKAQAEALTKAATAVHAAAKARDLKALVAANSDLTTACENCHKAYKPSLPTEGVVHQNPHSESHAHN